MKLLFEICITTIKFGITAIILLIVLSILAVIGGFLFSGERTFKGRCGSAFEAGAVAFSFLPIGIIPITFVFKLLFQ